MFTKEVLFFSECSHFFFLSDECEPHKRINKETDVGINFTVRTFIKRTAATNNNIPLFVAHTQGCVCRSPQIRMPFSLSLSLIYALIVHRADLQTHSIFDGANGSRRVVEAAAIFRGM